MQTREDGILEEFKLNAVAHGEATWNGDHKKANKAHDKLLKLSNKLEESGQLGRLVKLATDGSNAYVRLWSGVFLLRCNPDLGKKILSEIARQEDGLVATDARITLEEYEAGRLNP